MKYLLLFLISFNVHAISLTEIDALTLENRLNQIFFRLAPECRYEFDNNGVDFYDKQVLEIGQPLCTKPSLIEAQNELVVLKAELIVVEQARLDKLVRQLVIKSRLDVLEDMRLSMHKCTFFNANMKLFVKDIIKNELNSKVDCLELKNIEVITERIAREDKAAVDVTDRADMKGLRTILNTRALTNQELNRVLKYLLKAVR